MMAKRRPPEPRIEPLGPTPEAKRHGDYVLPESRGALAVYTNRRQNPLGQLLGFGTINRRQAAGGLCFIETYGEVWGTGGTSDSTVLRVGGYSHETERQAERMAKLRARLHTILNRIGPKAYSLMVSVCVFGESIGRDRGKNCVLYDDLRFGLDQCAIAYGISEDAA